MAFVTVGWKVWKGEHSPLVKAPDKTKWSPASSMFRIKSAADDFLVLAQKKHPEAKFEIRSVYKDDGLQASMNHPATGQGLAGE